MSSRASQRLNPSHYIPAGVARMERSEIRDSRDAGPGLRGACHRAALRADPLAPSGLQPLLQGFGGSLGQNAALPDASPPPELWVASSSQSCRIPYSSSGVLFSSGAARRMGGANGSRECVPDDKLRVIRDLTRRTQQSRIARSLSHRVALSRRPVGYCALPTGAVRIHSVKVRRRYPNIVQRISGRNTGCFRMS